MQKIEVAVLNESHDNPGGMMLFLAKLTQRGHNIKTMEDLKTLYYKCTEDGYKSETISNLASLPHGTIKRFTPITVAIVGASRRFLAQARTHQVGITYVSASLQYSDYSGAADFVVPYSLMNNEHAREIYLKSCENSMSDYDYLIKECSVDNDTAGYAAPQGLRNILVIQANHESWANFIRLRGCNRNTNETQYTTLRIWEELLKTTDGPEMFKMAGPDCVYGMCREGKMRCAKAGFNKIYDLSQTIDKSIPGIILDDQWEGIR